MSLIKPVCVLCKRPIHTERHRLLAAFNRRGPPVWCCWHGRCLDRTPGMRRLPLFATNPRCLACDAPIADDDDYLYRWYLVNHEIAIDYYHGHCFGDDPPCERG